VPAKCDGATRGPPSLAKARLVFTAATSTASPISNSRRRTRRPVGVLRLGLTPERIRSKGQKPHANGNARRGKRQVKPHHSPVRPLHGRQRRSHGPVAAPCVVVVPRPTHPHALEQGSTHCRQSTTPKKVRIRPPAAILPSMMSRSTRLAWPLPVGLLLYVLSDRPAGTLQSAYRGASSSAVSALAFRPRACHKGGRALWCESLAPQSARKRRAPTGSPLFPSGHAVT
jgi:hypothetical protein